MKLQIYSLFDRATKMYGNPMFLITASQMTRSLADEKANPDSVIAKHPEDYDAYHLGEWDSDTGAFEAIQPVIVVRAQDL